MPYGDFVKQRLLDPLGMTDTTYWPDEKQATRLAVTSRFNKEKSALEDIPNNPDKAWLDQPRNIPHVPLPLRAYLGDAIRAYPNRYAWPAGGLFSTAPDLAKFGEMMLNRGVSHGKRFVSEASFKRMTTVTPNDIPMRPQPSIGLGWFVTLRDTEGPAAGSFGHNGARGPVISVDPTHQLVMILMIESIDIHQRGQPPGDAQRKLRTAFFKAAVEKYGKPANR
jgi:CubicO group peptidase (beta-lactamase class C family)